MSNDMAEAFSNLAEGLIALTRQSHAGFVLSSVAMLEHDLQRCLLAQMRPLSSAVRKRLFDSYGPLSTFSAKIDLAFAFSIIGPESYDEFSKIKKIRNSFAHSKDLLCLDQEPILSLFRKLKRPKGVAGAYPKVFVECVIALDDELEQFLVGKGIKDDIRSRNLAPLATLGDGGQAAN